MKPLDADSADPRDVALAHKLRAKGVKNALRIVIECRHRHNKLIPVSLGLALQEQESGGRNIFGADIGRRSPTNRSRSCACASSSSTCVPAASLTASGRCS